MKRLFSSVGIVTLLGVTCVSCDKIKPPQPQLQPPPATSGQTRQQEAERKEFAQAAQKELDELRSVIAEFKAKAEAANVEAKTRLGEQVEKLEAEWRATQQQLSEFKSATVESGHQLTAAFGKSVEKLKNGIDNFRKKGS